MQSGYKHLENNAPNTCVEVEVEKRVTSTSSLFVIDIIQQEATQRQKQRGALSLITKTVYLWFHRVHFESIFLRAMLYDE